MGVWGPGTGIGLWCGSYSNTKAPCRCEPCGQYRRLQCATKCANECHLQVWCPPPLVTPEEVPITWEVFREWHLKTLPEKAPQNVSFESRSTYHETQTFSLVWLTSTNCRHAI